MLYALAVSTNSSPRLTPWAFYLSVAQWKEQPPSKRLVAGSNPARRTKPTTWDYKRIAQRSTHRLAAQKLPFLLTDSGDHPRHSLLLNSPESPTQINKHLLRCAHEEIDYARQTGYLGRNACVACKPQKRSWLFGSGFCHVDTRYLTRRKIKVEGPDRWRNDVRHSLLLRSAHAHSYMGNLQLELPTRTMLAHLGRGWLCGRGFPVCLCAPPSWPE